MRYGYSHAARSSRSSKVHNDDMQILNAIATFLTAVGYLIINFFAGTSAVLTAPLFGGHF